MRIPSFVIPGRVVRTLLLALLAAGCVRPAVAHDLWFEVQGDRRILHRGHRHAVAGHAGAGETGYGAGFVRQAVCIDASGGRSDMKPEAPLVVTAECARIVVRASSGTWTTTPWATVRGPKSEVADAVRSWRSFETIDRVERLDSAVTAPLGRGLEIVFVEDPRPVRPGRKLRVRVLFDGRPVEGAAVAYDESVRGTTGADGRINLRVRHTGVQRISATWRRPIEADDADEEIHTTTLELAVEEGTGS